MTARIHCNSYIDCFFASTPLAAVAAERASMPRDSTDDPAPRARDDIDDAPSSSSEPPPSARARASTHRGDESTSREKVREQRWRRKRARDGAGARVDGRGRRQKTQKSYRYGNYDRYYGYRVGEAMEDHRLSALRDEWFRGRRVADVGCNDGLFSLSLVGAFEPSACLCLDIDGDLVRAGERKLASLRRHAEAEAEAEVEVEDAPKTKTKKKTTSAFDGVEFRRANALEHDFGTETFDVILLLSVTKWIHLNFGDEGVRAVFRKCRDALVPGGSLILEPQPWRSYRSTLRKKVFGRPILPDECKARYGSIRFRPDAFADFLSGPEGGFFAGERLRVASEGATAFDRDVFRFVRR